MNQTSTDSVPVILTLPVKINLNTEENLTFGELIFKVQTCENKQSVYQTQTSVQMMCRDVKKGLMGKS